MLPRHQQRHRDLLHALTATSQPHTDVLSEPPRQTPEIVPSMTIWWKVHGKLRRLIGDASLDCLQNAVHVIFTQCQGRGGSASDNELTMAHGGYLLIEQVRVGCCSRRSMHRGSQEIRIFRIAFKKLSVSILAGFRIRRVDKLFRTVLLSSPS